MTRALLLLAALMPLAGCRPADAGATAAPRVTVETVRVRAGTFRVRVYLRYGNDGAGAADSVVVSLWVNPASAATQQHRLLATITKDSFTVASAGIGVPMTGSVKVFAIRRGLPGSETAVGWTYTEADQPPPPVIIDSLRVSSLLPLPTKAGGQMATDEQIKLCPVVHFADGTFARYSTATPGCVDAYLRTYAVGQRSTLPKQQAVADSVIRLASYAAVPVRPGVAFLPITEHEVYFRAPIAGAYTLILATS